MAEPRGNFLKVAAASLDDCPRCQMKHLPPMTVERAQALPVLVR